MKKIKNTLCEWESFKSNWRMRHCVAYCNASHNDRHMWLIIISGIYIRACEYLCINGMTITERMMSHVAQPHAIDDDTLSLWFIQGAYTNTWPCIHVTCIYGCICENLLTSHHTSLFSFAFFFLLIFFLCHLILCEFFSIICPFICRFSTFMSLHSSSARIYILHSYV